MAKNNKKKVIDIIPPRSKKIEKNKEEQIKAESIENNPEEVSGVFIKIESQTTQFIQKESIENEQPEEMLNKGTENAPETPSVVEEKSISEDKLEPVLNTKEPEEENEFIDKDYFFKELEEELLAKNQKAKPSLPQTEIKPNKKLLKKIVLSILSIALLSGVFYYLGFIVLPKAEISITAKKLKITNDNLTVLVDSKINQINADNKVIPGNLFTFTETVSKDFNSTGQGKDEKPAKGKIIIINNFSTSPQILIATTRFEHPSGKIYRLDSRIVVPGATLENGKLKPSSIEATVTADQPGPDYNIDACNSNNNCKFTIPAFKGTDKYNGFYAISNEPISGGSKGAAPMVTPQDIKNAEDTVLSEVNDKIQNDIKTQIPNGLKIINAAQSSLTIKKISSSANAGDYRQTFTETISGEVDVLAFKEDDLIELLRNLSNKDKPEKYNYCQIPQIDYKDAKVDFKNGQLKLIISYTLPLCYNLNANEIKNAIKGKSLKELNIILNSFEGIEAVKIKLYPFWIKKVPENINRINISID